MNINQENNFCRVFEVPENYPEGFLNSGPKFVLFKMVDWFNPIPQMDIVNEDLKSWSEYESMLKDFILKKAYRKPGRNYLILTDFGKSIVM